ncbi:MAG: hypothetical protein KDM91_01795 [Verrucomicrobiae bacterium]|nr:hypothetical protein [Verrucomicrobiae bacterium]
MTMPTTRFGSRRWTTPAPLWTVVMLAILARPSSAEAHVKWFSEFSFDDRPLSFREILAPLFFLLWGLSVAVSVTLTLLEERITRIGWVSRVDDWFASKKEHSLFVMRLGAGVTLIWCWQAGKLLAPDLSTEADWIVWLQIAVAILLVFDRTVRLAGAGLLALYVLAISQFGFFRMLDYLLWAGVGWFFLAQGARKDRVRITALPALYATLGFCLIWLGIEKLVYPSWSKLLLEEHPVLALGVEHDFFVSAAAMVEIGLGFMIMVCLQERLLALTISLLFVLTTLVFGREEVVGHTLIHTVLIVFLFSGPGEAAPPLHWISDLKWRVPATALAFILMVGMLMVPYTFGAAYVFEKRSRHAREGAIEVGEGANAPRLAIAFHKDSVTGWNLELIAENFEFTPAAAGGDPAPGQGHAHLYVDGEKVARLYGPWYHLRDLAPGRHTISVTLNANNHAALTVKGRPVEASTEIEVLTLPE